MANSYKVLKNKDTGNFDVIDENSGVLVYFHKEHKVASEVYRNLKSGKGFANWTPGFFAPIKTSYVYTDA